MVIQAWSQLVCPQKPCFCQQHMSWSMAIAGFCNHVDTASWTAISFYYKGSRQVVIWGGRVQTEASKRGKFPAVCFRCAWNQPRDHYAMMFSRKYWPLVVCLKKLWNHTDWLMLFCGLLAKSGRWIRVSIIFCAFYVQFEQMLWFF